MSSFQKIDTALQLYYQAFGEYDYFDNDGIGKFLHYCNEQEFDDNDIDDELADGNEANCGYIEFDPNIPLRVQIENASESEKQSEIFRVLQTCVKTGFPPCLTGVDLGILPLPGTNTIPKLKKPFKFASPERAKRFVLQISNTCEIGKRPKKKDYIQQKQKEKPKKLNDLEKLCFGLGKYYHAMRRNDYYDEHGIGKFTKWFESEQMDINEMKDELIDGNVDDCSYLDFDCDEITKVNKFPLASDIDDKLQKQFEIMAHIYDSNDANFSIGKLINFTRDILPQINPYSIKFDLRKQDIDRLYEKQCPRLMRLFSKENDLMYLLSIGYYNNNVPFALWMVDCFMRDRWKYYLENNYNKELSVHEWFENNINQYIDVNIKKKYINAETIISSLEHGIKSYIYRILPKFRWNLAIHSAIKDDLFEIAHYIEAASQFILKIINENEFEKRSHTPFQWDFLIAVRDVTDCNNIVIPDVDGDGQDDDKEDSFYEYYDIIGDIKKKLLSNNCAYYVTEVDNMADNNRLKNNLLIRVFKESYDQFKEKYDGFNDSKENVFPRMRRFCTLIDRRKWVTTTEATQCDINSTSYDNESDSECEYHEIEDRNSFGGKKDDIYFWIPPDNCNVLPHNKRGYVSEIYFENINKCIIPRNGYIESMVKEEKDHFHIEDSIGTHTATKCQLLRKTFTNTCPHDGVLIFNFHVESIDEIRCYLWYKGTGIRFIPNDIINVLPLLFDKTYENNDKFIQSENIKQLIQQIQFNDQCFQKWYQNVTN